MTCPSELTRSRYVDAALSRAAANDLEAHLAGCATCTANVAALAAERRAIGAALRTAERGAGIPAFEPPAQRLGLLAWAGFAAFGTAMATVAWASLTVAAWIPTLMSRLLPDAVGGGVELAVGVALHAVRGGDLLATVTRPAGAVALTAFVLLGALRAVWRRSGDGGPLCLAVAACAVLLTAAPATLAFEVRSDADEVTIAEDETVDDTLVVMADSVRVEGTVTGDLVVLGDSVIVRGRIGGQLVAMADALDVDAVIGGNVVGLGDALKLNASAIGGNLYGAGDVVSVGAGSRVAGNAALAAGEADVQGEIGRDLLALAEHLDLAGRVRDRVVVYAEAVDVRAGARIGGDLRATVEDADKLRVADPAAVAGATHVEIWTEDESDYLSLDHYVGLFVRFLAALVTGLALLRVFPAFARMRLDDGRALATAGLGAVAVFATPFAAAAVLVTLIGAPLGLLALCAWLAGLYVAGIAVAGVVGRALFPAEGHNPALPLLLGLVVVFVLTSLPFVGALFRLAAVVVGAGLIVRELMDAWTARAGA